METYRIPIEGMTCTSCIAHITKAVRKVPGVAAVKVDLATGSAVVTFDPALGSELVDIEEAIGKAGYEARLDLAQSLADSGIRERRGILAWLGGRGTTS